MNSTEVIMVVVALALIVAVPWIGTLLGARNFDKKLNRWRSTQIVATKEDRTA